MSTPVIILSNRGPKYLPQCIESIERHIKGADDINVICDRDQVGFTRMMGHVFGTVQDYGWRRVFFIEEDMLIRRDIDLAELHAILDADPSLAQVRLARGPWFRNEKRSGVAANWWPSGWTCNPSLIAADTFRFDWPQVEWSEQAFGELLTRNGKRFACYGDENNPYVEHIGAERAPTSKGY